MTIYTHNSPRNYEAMSIHMIVTDKPRSELNIGDDWYEVDADEVEVEELLAGTPYPKLKGLHKLYIEGFGTNEVTKWGFH